MVENPIDVSLAVVNASNPTCHHSARETVPSPLIQIRGLNVTAGTRMILRNIHLNIVPQQVFAIIGPSGAGKTTLLKCMNRMAELTPGLKVSGDVLLSGSSIYAKGVNPDALRTQVGILFQQPVVFPTSIEGNVLFGIKRLGVAPRKDWPQIAEQALRETSLWDEVKDRLNDSALKLSIGQQQRLCLARTLATRPKVILMDEPTSALDPRATQAIEDLLVSMKMTRTIVMVTHNLAQARRVADWIGCVCVNDGVGELMETACCDLLLDRPQCRAVAEYLRYQKPSEFGART